MLAMYILREISFLFLPFLLLLHMPALGCYAWERCKMFSRPAPPGSLVLPSRSCYSLCPNTKTLQAAAPSQAANKPSSTQNCLLHHSSKSQKQLLYRTALTLFPPHCSPFMKQRWTAAGTQVQSGNLLQLSNNKSFVPTALEAPAFPFLMLVMA